MISGAEPDAPIVVEAYFAVPPATAFQAWTEPDLVKKWFGPSPGSLHSASIDLRPGGAWRFVEHQDDTRAVGFEGRYLEIEIAARLVFSWSRVVAHANGEREATPESQVEIDFTPDGTGTHIRVTHSAIQDAATRENFGNGWSRGIANLTAWLGGTASGT